MTQYSFPWNDVNGDRLYDADDFMRFFAAFLKTGVVMSYKGGLRVRSAQNGMNIQVGSGSAVIGGSSYLNDADIGIQVNVASSIQDRVDSVVLRMDKNARTTQLFYKPGDTTVARNDTTYELQLATISVKTNATQITDADITDMRSDTTVCGWSTPFDNINVDGIVDQYKIIFEQKDLEFQTWFQNLKNQLDDNQASNLQNQIDNLGSEKANDDEVVHNTGDEDIAGKKTFEDLQIKGVFLERTATTTISGPYAVSCTLRRTGNLVELVSERKVIGSPTGHEQSDAGISFPSGYRPISRALAKFELNNGNTLFNPMILRIDSNGSSYLTNEAYSGNRYAQSYATWVTNDPWPAET